jgi:hypothetical protein
VFCLFNAVRSSDYHVHSISRLQSVRIHRIFGDVFYYTSLPKKPLLLMKPHVLVLHIKCRTIPLAMLLLGCVLILAPAHGDAQARAAFALRDTVVQRGSVYRFTIRASVSNLPAKLDSMRLVVRYTPSLLFPEAALGGGANLFLCPTPRMDVEFTNLSLGRLFIACNQILSTPRDTVILCSVDFRILASADALATLTIDSLIANTTPLAVQASMRTARITVRGEPQVVGEFTDAIEPSYPNPANADGLTFPYIISELSNVQFTVFSARGEEVYQFPDVRRGQGRFLLRFIPPPFVPSGAYSLRMVTSRGVVQLPFMFLR